MIILKARRGEESVTDSVNRIEKTVPRAWLDTIPEMNAGIERPYIILRTTTLDQRKISLRKESRSSKPIRQSY
jgi:hypothetical protein